MKPQEIFDLVVSHLRLQSQKSQVFDNNQSFFMYKNPDGLMCPVGFLIMDDEYHPDMEGKPVHKVIFMGPTSLRDRLSQHINLLSRLQAIHDGEPIEKWEQLLEFAAKDFKLNYSK
jgi:hypothetical protein